MTTPRVTELPRRLEPICADTFIGEGHDDEARPALRSLPGARDAGPPGVVVQLRPRDPLAAPRKRRGPRVPRGFLPGGGSGNDAA